jgi:predicted nucleic acid-binding protein
LTDFLDTNILFYATTNDTRSPAAVALFAAGGRIAVQSLNEYALATRRRAGRSWDKVDAAIGWFLSCCPPPVPLTLDVDESGLIIARRYRLHLYDSMIVAAALADGADTLWSEDMHDGLIISGQPTIRNPFRT